MADLIETLNAQAAKLDALRNVHDADTRELRTAISALTDALMDLTAAVTLLDKDAALAAGRADDRAKTLDELRRKVDDMVGKVDAIATPLIAANAARIEAEARAEANKANLFSHLTPQRVAWALAFIASLAAAGGFGANFRGCAAILQTTADAQPATKEE